ncbi:PTS transporter subunit EIIC [Tetragenococcus halophilus]|uniref:PTS transporter subunit EIIC n=1 Tax=Tetragenococcus halophilus TaxID=51669 RepID=UPI000CA93682|nr:PTS transporter subunit EIIC [Tetragenococcus halophilus]MDN6166919.1 PTS transporter subunit EIIC [Tetragenococcus koreensis]MDN6571877.1 PTS transporter subunit EIIC [Staphylococcus equorum]MCF1601942.1 PTS transporter subunit EIIC [Tetragenococcus halophilus]MCO8283434.1 PTS transporter subunit EIIC [Tetragenococcus halophilus]MCO8291223.1 PTS transporter subunit EIIC [Tetragenococcus halophilus]
MEKVNKDSLGTKFINIIGNIFGPVINVLCAAGLLKGILTICLTTGILSEASNTYNILSVLSDAFFYFLPVFLAYTSAEVFKVSKFSAVLLAVFLVHPQLNDLFENGANTIFGIPYIVTNYTSTVLPIILAVFVMKFVEGFFEKIIHDSIKDMLVPLFTLLIIVPLTLIILGPIGNSIASFVTYGYNYLMNISFVIGMAVLSFLFPVFIMFGISTALASVVIKNIATNGSDTILISLGCSLFALAGMSLAVYLKTTDNKLKGTALSATITALLGVGEPAVFGVGIEARKPFLLAMSASAIGGAIVGVTQSKVTAFLIPNVVTLPAYIGQPGYIGTFLGCFVAFIISFGCTFLINKEKLLSH